MLSIFMTYLPQVSQRISPDALGWYRVDLTLSLVESSTESQGSRGSNPNIAWIPLKACGKNFGNEQILRSQLQGIQPTEIESDAMAWHYLICSR
jgi:hypothetical protein